MLYDMLERFAPDLSVSKIYQSIYNIVSLSRQEQAFLMRLHFERYEKMGEVSLKTVVSQNFPDLLKLAIVFPVYKAKDSLDKTNYGSVGILLILAKIYERFLFDHLFRHANRI